MRVALLFTDGVGVGRRDPAFNPLAREAYLLSQFDDGTGTTLPAGGRFSTVDATFGVLGRPQSATNQTAMLTGEPAPVLLGKHLLGFPNAFLRELLSRRSIVKRLVDAGRRAELCNGYPAGFLDVVGLAHHSSPGPDVVIPERAVRKLRPSATACAFSAGPVLLRTFEDVRAGRALTHDIQGLRARARGFDVPERSFDAAAAVFWNAAERADFTFFEHSLADEAGHAQDDVAAAAALGGFDGFARAVIAARPADAVVVICSDHGNVEDLSIRNHTLARIPILRFGPDEALESPLGNLAHLGQAVLHWTGVERPSA